MLKLHPDELVRLAPRLKPYLHRSSPTWPELVDAADWLRHDLDVSNPLWGEACLVMEREQAAIALAVVSTKVPSVPWIRRGTTPQTAAQKAEAAR